jgi:type III restriction enzyme
MVETKGTLFADGLRSTEAARILCGEVHFKALATGDNPARYLNATKVEDLLAGS